MAKAARATAKNQVVDRSPTMIIPNGTEIEVDVHGQLSIRTPGNLVLQNSGNYGTLESLNGSIRIEPHVQVEAVQVKCADVCYIQGSLTAWKVRARAIELEDSARAHIILQETESLQIGREARLVGNFGSENELFLLFSRFAKQMRSLPFGLGRDLVADGSRTDGSRQLVERESRSLSAAPTDGERSADGGNDRGNDRGGALGAGVASSSSEEASTKPPAEAPVPAIQSELPDSLFFALVLLEREAEKPSGGPTHHRIVGELARLLREREIETLRRTHQSLWSQLLHPNDDLKRVRELIVDHFG